MYAASSRVWSTAALLVFVSAVGGLLIARGTASSDLGALATGPFVFLTALVVAAMGLTSVHEAAHAIVGRLVGWEVFGVTIGRGRRLASLHLGSVRLELRGMLVGGVTIAQPTGRRSRDVAMLVAGVTVETIVIAAALRWEPGSAWGHHGKWAIVLVACTDIAINLWPHRVDVGPVTGMASDGAQLVTVLTSTDEWRRDLERLRLTPGRARLVQTLHGGDIEEALDLSRAEAAANPTDDDATDLVGALLLLAGHWREAFEHLAPHVNAPDPDPMLANNTAWAAVMTFDPSLLPHADRLSELAHAALPIESACANTRGSTLVLLGRADEGLPLLEFAASGRISQKQKAFVLAFTALAEHQLHRFRGSRKHLAMAEALDRDCPALPEVRRLMPEPRTAATAPAVGWPPPKPADRSDNA